jgi:tRNA pseudouridine55 synthase
VREASTDDLNPERLETALAAFLGWMAQVPPARSNKRIGGERAWKRALRGEAVQLPPVRVYLHRARWLEHQLPVRSTLEVCCRGGFYVRSLVVDLARTLGSAAHLQALHRASIGPWDDPGVDREAVITGPAAAPWFPSRELSDDDWGRLRAGHAISAGAAVPAPWSLPDGFPPTTLLVRGLHRGRLVALLEACAEGWRSRVALPGGLR